MSKLMQELENKLTAIDTPSYLIDAISGFISDDWKG